MRSQYINKNMEYKINNQIIDSIDLKALLVGRGVRVSSRVYSIFESEARLSPDPLQCNAVILPDNTVVQLTDLAFHLKYLRSSLSLDSRQNIKYMFQLQTPFKLNVDEFNRAAIFHKKQKITNVTFPRHTDFYKQTTSSGLPYFGNAVLQGTEWLSFYMLWPCDYACAGEPCQYCYPGGELAALTKWKKRLPRYPTPNDVAEIVKYAVTSNLANSIQITGGSTFNVQAECDKIKAILDTINNRVGRHNISGEIIVYTTPPADPSLLEQLFEAGANRVSCSLEIWDEELAKVVMPGKMKFTGRKRHLAALEYIASKYGPNKACSNFIIGIESIASLLAGAEYLASRGIVPVASVWIPFGRPVLNKMKALDLEYYQAVKRGFSEIYHKYGIEPPGGFGLNVCICRDIWLQNNKIA